MSDTSIQWTDKTWNPVRGCSVISPGCVNCYAMKQAHRFSGPGGGYEGLTKQTGAGPQWTGRIAEVVPALNIPLLKWKKKPQRIFVNSMSDLFHEGVSDEFILNVFTVMAVAKHHTFQILTKRPERMLALLSSWRADDIYTYWHGYSGEPAEIQSWPLPNVIVGISVEDQPRANERFQALCELGEAGWRTMVSMEPLLELVTIPKRYLALGVRAWVIAGGESGKGLKIRPFNINWARAAYNQCFPADVAFFLKQIGARAFDTAQFDEIVRFDSYEQWVNKARSWLGGISGGGVKYKKPERAVCVDQKGRVCHIGRDFMRARDEGAFPVKAFAQFSLQDPAGGDPIEWPADLRVREFPTVAA